MYSFVSVQNAGMDLTTRNADASKNGLDSLDGVEENEGQLRAISGPQSPQAQSPYRNQPESDHHQQNR